MSYKQRCAAKLRVARKISRSQQRAFSMKLLKEQQGLCPLCSKPISLQVMGNKSDYALDHCHVSGLVRGVLHRSCNAALGKMEKAIGQWGAKSMDMDAILEYLDKAILYYNQEPQAVIYPDHKTDEQKAAATKLKAATARAMKAARLKIAAKKAAPS